MEFCDLSDTSNFNDLVWSVSSSALRDRAARREADFSIITVSIITLVSPLHVAPAVPLPAHAEGSDRGAAVKLGVPRTMQSCATAARRRQTE